METAQTQPTARAPRASKLTRTVGFVIVALAAIWLVAFILSNSETVRVSFVFAHVRVSLIWVMIICAALGAGLAWAVPRLSRAVPRLSRRRQPSRV